MWPCLPCPPVGGWSRPEETTTGIIDNPTSVRHQTGSETICFMIINSVCQPNMHNTKSCCLVFQAGYLDTGYWILDSKQIYFRPIVPPKPRPKVPPKPVLREPDIPRYQHYTVVQTPPPQSFNNNKGYVRVRVSWPLFHSFPKSKIDKFSGTKSKI